MPPTLAFLICMAIRTMTGSGLVFEWSSSIILQDRQRGNISRVDIGPGTGRVKTQADERKFVSWNLVPR